MPSDRKQINVRVSPEQEAMLPLLCAAVSAATGLTVTNSDLFRMGMHELAKKYPLPPLPTAAPDVMATKRGRGRPKKGS